jgi:hypothetical protein
MNGFKLKTYKKSLAEINLARPEKNLLLFTKTKT